MADKGEEYAYSGYLEVVPDYGGKQTTTYYQSNKGGQSSYNQTTTTVKNYDKQTGSYARASNREVFSSGDTFKERSTGRVGFKDEYKTTNTYKVGDKTGFVEYQKEERFRHVSYGGSSNSNKGNKYLK